MTDVVVVGAGNAALCAALAARQAGARVTVLERAAPGEGGGNSAFTAGAMRVAYDTDADLRPLMADPDDPRLSITDFGSYPVARFVDDLMTISDGRCERALAHVVADRSRPTLQWMRGHGVGFEPSYGQQAFEVDGRWVFWGGLAVRVRGEGKGLVGALCRAVERAGIDIRYRARAVGLITRRGRVTGVRTVVPDGERGFTGSVVLACGGFEANREWRARHLGPEWARAKVRGTTANTGDGIEMALHAGAGAHGDWSGCHSVAWDRDAPDSGDLEVAHQYTRNSYQFGIMVNRDGLRFLDEGADFRNYTYARYGAAVLAQPGGVAWQVFDGRVLHLLRDEYHRADATKVEAGTLNELAAGMDGVDIAAFAATITEFNAGVTTEVTFDPNTKDGRCTVGLDPPKSNWANPIDRPPFRAYPVTCGITFTFGGLHVDAHARVLDTGGQPIPGLHAAGELVGGLFYGNYPGGSGLTAGAVLGRIAGIGAAGSA